MKNSQTTISQQKIITASVIAGATVGGFEALVYILNLNQTRIFVHTAFWIYGYLFFMMALLFDLHFKNINSLEEAMQKHEKVSHWFLRFVKTLGTALWKRFEHIIKWQYIALWLHYLVVPSLIFWSTVGIFYVNMGQTKVQQSFILLSSLALTVNFWYLKEVFLRKVQVLEKDIYIPLAVIKIYASLVVYSALTVFIRRYCLDAQIYVLLIFLVTFSLIYQALFQHRLVTGKNLIITFLISLALGLFGYGVLVFWGFNYFTAAAFLTIVYNLCWGVFHYYLDKTITWKAFWEIVLFSLLISIMIFSVTNFRARILNDCEYGGVIKNSI
jgi:hypothetical protein